VVERWDRQGGAPNQGLLLLLMGAEFQSGSYTAAIRVADRMLANWPDDKAATDYRLAAVKKLREQADALLPPKPTP
jgi:hypothetical protein